MKCLFVHITGQNHKRIIAEYTLPVVPEVGDMIDFPKITDYGIRCQVVGRVLIVDKAVTYEISVVPVI